MTLVMLLAPSLLSVVWLVFVFSENPVVKLMTLLFVSLTLPTTFTQILKMFWPCGLLLILMSTGLLVIFAYIVGLHSKEEKFVESMWLMVGGSLVFLSTTTSLNISAKSILFLSYHNIIMSSDLSLLLFFLLLFLVISFIRIIYSKGGGFRKKF